MVKTISVGPDPADDTPEMPVDAMMTSLSVFTPEDIVREVKNLPSAPKVLPHLKRLLSDGNSSIHEIVALIRIDPGISARVLRVANSAYFGKGVRCVAVDEAVQRVGFDEIYNLVGFAVSAPVMARSLDAYALDADTVWKNAVACALAAEMLALRTAQDCDVAYTIGLLHSVGMVVIDEWIRANQPQLRLRFTGFPREAVASERIALGFTQAEAGAALLQHWDFPPDMSEPVRWQYAPRSSALHTKMTSLLHAAKWLRSVVCAGAAGKPAPLDAGMLQPLGLRPEALERMTGELESQLSAVSSLLELGPGKTRPPEQGG
ncbi:MAG: putative signal transduction protein [Verrucomicrobia bacterium]|nr:putative signal transduction protein [Verrucomicrobiota bacterium]